MIFSGGYPQWFLGYDALIEILFFLVTGFIGWFTFRIYRLSKERKFLWWSVGFLAIAGGYFVNAYANYYILGNVIGIVSKPVPTTMDVNWLHLLGHLAYVGFFLAGYLLLSLVALDFEDTRLVTLFGSLLLVLTIGIVMSGMPLLLNIALILLLCHIILFSWFPKKKRTSSKLRRFVMLGFGLVLLGQLSYLIVPLFGLAYVLGHLFELLGFSLFGGSMIYIMKK